jgi:hypothetical protein
MVEQMRKFGLLLVPLAAAAALAACGGGSGSSSFATTGSATSSGAGGTGGSGGTGTVTTYSMGNGSGSGFLAGMIGITPSTSLSAGGSASLSLSIVDQTGTLYTGASVTITLNSPCIAQGLATVTASGSTTAGANPGTVMTSTGLATATYTAKGCSGGDVITATATVVSQSLTASGTITVAAATVGSIQFISASPTTIGLKGTGVAESSTVTFKVLDSTGAARPGAAVNFSLNTTVGGITLAPSSATSAADGTVTTVVSSGTEHTSVRVTATIASPALSTQSSVLTVTTGLPASAAFSLAVGAPSYAPSGTGLACPNVEAYGQDGVIVPVTARLADRYNNPAPDGTAVAFTTDGGHIVGSCQTPSAPGAGDGTCSVNWTSADPRPSTSSTPPAMGNGRAMILATAIGEESFTDLNGNGYWDTGEPFSNLGEPYRDDNENNAYDLGEYFLDFNKNGLRDAGDGTFKGITCSGSSCSTTTLAIGAQHVLIMSTSVAQIVLTGISGGFTGNASGLSINHSVTTPTPINSTGTISYTVKDLNNNPVAAGTTVTVAADSSIGTIATSSASWTIGCRTAVGGEALTAGFTAGSTTTGGNPGGNITITVTSPGTKTQTLLSIPVTIN